MFSVYIIRIHIEQYEMFTLDVLTPNFVAKNNWDIENLMNHIICFALLLYSASCLSDVSSRTSLMWFYSFFCSRTRQMYDSRCNKPIIKRSASAPNYSKILPVNSLLPKTDLCHRYFLNLKLVRNLVNSPLWLKHLRPINYILENMDFNFLNLCMWFFLSKIMKSINERKLD